jgi:NADPH:quinone reductase
MSAAGVPLPITRGHHRRMTTATMRAVVLDDFGGPLVPRELPIPEPGPGEVLVRVAASAVNPLDLKIRAGAAAHAQVQLPAVLGIDMAGTVARAGAGVTAFSPGDEVYGMTGGVGSIPGSLAGYQAADARLIARKPANLSMAQAAALPLAVITAWEGLVDRAQAGNGETVLVHGGAGGVGYVAIQLAVARGARVYATGTSASAGVIADAGATPIDYRATTVEEYVGRWTGGDGFDVIFDTVGGATLDASFTAVRRYTGRVVSILGWGTHSLAPLSFRGASYSGVFTLLPLLTGHGRRHHGEILAQAAVLAEKGALRPLLHPQPFALTEVSAAHDAASAAGTRGRVVVSVAQHPDQKEDQHERYERCRGGVQPGDHPGRLPGLAGRHRGGQ